MELTRTRSTRRTKIFANCSSQRPLNESGREQARLIGEKFREFRIPVGEVYASVVCRCEETVAIGFREGNCS